MLRKAVFAGLGLLLLVFPVVASAQVVLPQLPANPTIQDLQNEIQMLIQILNLLLAQRHPNNNPITVTSPNGGEQWEEGVLNTVTWTPYNYNPDINPSRDVTAYLERACMPGTSLDQQCNNGFATLGRVEESGKASIHWITGELNSASQGGVYAPPGSGYYIRVVNNATGAWDRSHAPFTILPRAVDLKANDSDGPLTLSGIQPISLSWITHGVQNCSLNISRTGNVPHAVAPSGSEAFVFDPSITPFISLTCQRVSTGETVGDYVSIISSTPSPVATLKILSPNGGEQIPYDQPYAIRWSSTGLSTVAIALYKNDKWSGWINKNVIPSGKDVDMYIWTPSQTVPPLVNDQTFKIYITGQKADGTGYVDDKSDGTFSFTSATSSCPGGYLWTGSQCVAPPPIATTTLTVSSGQQPPNTIAPQGAIVPFTSFTLTNTGANDISVVGLQLVLTGLLQEGAFHDAQIVDNLGNKIMASRTASGSLFPSVPNLIFDGLTIPAGQSRTYTVSGWMESNLSPYAGEVGGLSLIALGGNFKVNGYLGIVGAQNTINSTLNVCFPPQTAVYGYQCWAPTISGNGTLTVSTDASSPSLATVAAGATNAVLGVYKFHATNESILLNRVGLNLTSGKASDLMQVYLYNGAQLIGNALFTGTNTQATSTLFVPTMISKDGDLQIVIRGDISQVGTGQPGTAGDIIKVDYQSAQGTGVTTSQIINASGSTNVAGVQIAGNSCAPNCANSFTTTPTSGTAPLQVTFLGTVSGSTNLGLSFGDGSTPVSVAASSINQTYTYNSAGTYTATLTSNGTAVGAVVITVSAQPAPTPAPTPTPTPSVSNTDSQRKQDLQTLAAALNSYYQKHSTYVVAGAGAGGSGAGVVSKDGSPTIIQALYNDGDLGSSANLPTNPSSANDYYLLYTCGPGTFALSARLDNPSSSDISNIQASCNGTGPNGTYPIYGRNYSVSGRNGAMAFGGNKLANLASALTALESALQVFLKVLGQ